MITLSLDAPEPWVTNFRAAAAGWPAGVALHSDRASPATIEATVRDPAAPSPLSVAIPAGAARASISSRTPLPPDWLTAWARRTVMRLPLATPVAWPGKDEAEETLLPRDPSAVRTTRRELTRLFGHAARSEDIVLAASEIAANAVQHAAGPTSLVTRATADRLVIEISDTDPVHLPRVLPLQTATASGRGMAIIDQISDCWGVLSMPSSKVVWCEFFGVGLPSHG